jgi:hypothetical protein
MVRALSFFFAEIINDNGKQATISGLYYKCFTIIIYDRNDSG